MAGDRKSGEREEPGEPGILSLGLGHVADRAAGRAEEMVVRGEVGIPAGRLSPGVDRANAPLRREALELTLYTFKYVGGVDSVIALLPPPPKDSTVNWALFFKKSDFHTELSQPLSRTLPSPLRGKLTPGSVVGNSDQQTVEKLTRPYWYTSQFQQLQDGNAVLVLDPLIAAS